MSDSRYEIKFILNDIQIIQAMKWINFHTSASKAYPPRVVNSIYFDNNNFDSVGDNLMGISKRSKYRLRWYGERGTEVGSEFFFEIKMRNNRYGKKIKKIIKFDLPLSDLNYGEMQSIVEKQLAPEFMMKQSLSPTLQVAYERQYFEGSNAIRVTLDKGIKFYNITKFSKVNSSKPISYPMNILEVKFSPDQQKAVSRSFERLHLVPKRHSKYLVGMSMLGNSVYV